MMKKYKVGLIIGRFQPFHKGHEYLFSEALQVCEKIIIGIGSSNRKNAENPWTPKERRNFIKEFIRKKAIEDKVIKIINVEDHPDDEIWYEILIAKTGYFDVTIGNNDWNNGIIENHGIKAIYTKLLKREELEGYKIRELMRNKKQWQNRVPSYLQSKIRSLSAKAENHER